MTAAAGGERASGVGAPMNIGAVLALLRHDFPDISISKIRFLEDQGLVEPERTPAGYRKFSPADVDRLRYVLGVQRDHYLPLRVIRDHLEALDQGLEPPVTRGGPRAPRLVESDGHRRTSQNGHSGQTGHGGHGGPGGRGEDRREPPSDGRMTRAALLASAQITESVLAELESHGLIQARPGGRYDQDALLIAGTARQLAAFGVGPRHLRAFRSAADREAGLVEQVVNPLRRQRGPEAAARAEEASLELTALCLRLHAALVKAALERDGH